jgi:hypothetical protein
MKRCLAQVMVVYWLRAMVVFAFPILIILSILQYRLGVNGIQSYSKAYGTTCHAVGKNGTAWIVCLLSHVPDDQRIYYIVTKLPKHMKYRYLTQFFPSPPHPVL